MNARRVPWCVMVEVCVKIRLEATNVLADQVTTATAHTVKMKTSVCRVFMVVTPMHDVATLSVHTSASAIKALMEMDTPALTLMNAL